jgi:hypothetical protein
VKSSGVAGGDGSVSASPALLLVPPPPPLLLMGSVLAVMLPLLTAQLLAAVSGARSEGSYTAPSGTWHK